MLNAQVQQNLHKQYQQQQHQILQDQQKQLQLHQRQLESNTKPAKMVKTMSPESNLKDQITKTTLDDVGKKLQEIKSCKLRMKVAALSDFISLEEVTLMMASGQGELVSLALVILETFASADQNTFKVPQGALLTIVDCLVDIFINELAHFMKTPQFVECVSKIRPLDYLNRKYSAEIMQSRSRNGSLHLHSVVRILVAFSERSDIAAIFSQCNRLVWGLLLPSVTSWQVYKHLSVESYLGLLQIISNVASKIILCDTPEMESFIDISLNELDNNLIKIRFGTSGMNVCWPGSVPPDMSGKLDPEVLRAAILHCEAVWRKSQPITFTLLESLYRILCNETLELTPAMSPLIFRIMTMAWEYFINFQSILVLQTQVALMALQQVGGAMKTLCNDLLLLHDGGIIELCLSIVLAAMNRLDQTVWEGWADNALFVILRLLNDTRKVFTRYQPASNASSDVEQIKSLNSHLYHVQRLLIAIGMVMGEQVKSLGLTHIEWLSEWVSTPAPNQYSLPAMQLQELSWQLLINARISS